MKRILILLLLFSNKSYSQTTPEELAELWVEAIKSKSKVNLMKIIHPKCKKSDISPQHLTRMISGELPPKYKVHIQNLNLSKAQSSYYKVAPSRQVSLKYQLDTLADKKLYGLGKAFPAAIFENKWYFVLCLK
ncbi:MAG: hypothetical protein BM556_16860 [Bacteriovorax sp. MedPE-SWde]|nr:MAG: hypothetical protein BM556_16860 [Bacteriovorax sp. MedPE-SWde]